MCVQTNVSLMSVPIIGPGISGAFFICFSSLDLFLSLTIILLLKHRHNTHGKDYCTHDYFDGSRYIYLLPPATGHRTILESHKDLFPQFEDIALGQ